MYVVKLPENIHFWDTFFLNVDEKTTADSLETEVHSLFPSSLPLKNLSQVWGGGSACLSDLKRLSPPPKPPPNSTTVYNFSRGHVFD